MLRQHESDDTNIEKLSFIQPKFPACLVTVLLLCPLLAKTYSALFIGVTYAAIVLPALISANYTYPPTPLQHLITPLSGNLEIKVLPYQGIGKNDDLKHTHTHTHNRFYLNFFGLNVNYNSSSIMIKVQQQKKCSKGSIRGAQG